MEPGSYRPVAFRKFHLIFAKMCGVCLGGFLHILNFRPVKMNNQRVDYSFLRHMVVVT